MPKVVNLITNVVKSNLNIPSIYKVNFALTYKCNHRCVNCGIWKIRPKNELKLNDIEKFFTKNQFSWINLTGGEIFLRNDIDEIFKIIAEKNKNLSILSFTSNGLLTKKIVRSVSKLSKYKIPTILATISMDGQADLYKKIRGIDAFSNAINTYKLLRQIDGIKSEVGYTIFPENAGKLADFVSFMIGEIPSFSCNDIHVNTYNVSGHFYSNKERRENIENYNKKASNDIKYYLANYKRKMTKQSIAERAFQNFEIEFMNNNKNPIRCKSCLNSLFLDPFGNIYPCIIWNEKIGNIKDFDYNLPAIYENKKYRELIDLIRKNKCPNCWTICEAVQTMLGNLTNVKLIRKMLQ